MNKLFKDDILTVDINVKGETDNYIVKISFGGLCELLKDQIEKQGKLDYKAVTRALILGFNKDDVYIRCSCPDSQYRFAYWQSKNNIITGDAETRPSDITNPDDTRCYIAKTFTETSQPLTFAEICGVAKREPNLIIEWIIPKGYIVIETKETNILPALQGKNSPVLVAKIKDTLYIYCKSTFDRTTTNNVLACGITANTYAYNKSGKSIMLPFKMKTCTEPIFKEIKVSLEKLITI